MTALSITAASVLPDTDANYFVGIAGVAITAGQLVYYDTTTGTYKLTDSDALATSQVAGVALDGAAAGQPVVIQDKGTVTIGATIAAGVAYVASQTAGGISPLADLLTGDYLCIVGYGASGSTTKILLDIQKAAPILVA